MFKLIVLPSSPHISCNSATFITVFVLILLLLRNFIYAAAPSILELFCFQNLCLFCTLLTEIILSSCLVLNYFPICFLSKFQQIRKKVKKQIYVFPLFCDALLELHEKVTFYLKANVNLEFNVYPKS